MNSEFIMSDDDNLVNKPSDQSLKAYTDTEVGHKHDNDRAYEQFVEL